MPRRRSRARAERKFTNRGRTSSQSSVEIQVTQNETYVSTSSTTTVSISTGPPPTTGQLVLPSVGFANLLKTVGARGVNAPQGELFTLKQLCYYLKEYIKCHSLYDPLDPIKVYCNNDPLRQVFGVDKFTLNDAIYLVKNATKTIDATTSLYPGRLHNPHAPLPQTDNTTDVVTDSVNDDKNDNESYSAQIPQISIMDALMAYPSQQEGFPAYPLGRESPALTEPQPEADPSVSSTTITPKLGQLPPAHEVVTSEEDDIIPPTQAPLPRAALFRDVNGNTGRQLSNMEFLANQRTALSQAANQRTALSQASVINNETSSQSNYLSRHGANTIANQRAGLNHNHGNSDVVSNENLCTNVTNTNEVSQTVPAHLGTKPVILDNGVPSTNITDSAAATTATTPAQGLLNHNKNNDNAMKMSRKRKRKKHSSTCSTDSHQGEDVADGDYTLMSRKRGSSLSIMYTSDGEADGQPWSLRVEWQDSQESDETVLSVQSKETELVRDSSDDFWFLDSEDEISVQIGESHEEYQPYPGSHGNPPGFEEEYEVQSESSVTQDQETDEDESDSPYEEIIVVCTESDVGCWADSESSDAEDESTDEDLKDEDRWQCSRCDTRNSPLRRFCDLCMTLREGWVSEKKSQGRGITRPRHRRSVEKDLNGVSEKTQNLQRNGQETVTSQGTSQKTVTSQGTSQGTVTSQGTSQKTVTSQGTSKGTGTSQSASQESVSSQAETMTSENSLEKSASTETGSYKLLNSQGKVRSPRKRLLSPRIRLQSSESHSPRRPPRFYGNSDLPSPRRPSSVQSPRKLVSPRLRHTGPTSPWGPASPWRPASPWGRSRGQEQIFQFPSSPLPVDVSFPLEMGGRHGAHGGRSFSMSDGQAQAQDHKGKILAAGSTAIKNLSFIEPVTPYSHYTQQLTQQGEDEVFEAKVSMDPFSPQQLSQLPSLSSQDSGLGGSLGWGSGPTADQRQLSTRATGPPDSMEPPQGSQQPTVSSQDSAIEADQSFSCSPSNEDTQTMTERHIPASERKGPSEKAIQGLPSDHKNPLTYNTGRTDTKVSPAPSRTRPKPLTLRPLMSLSPLVGTGTLPSRGPHSPYPAGAKIPYPGGTRSSYPGGSESPRPGGSQLGGPHPRGSLGQVRGLQVPLSYAVPASPRKRTASGTEYNDLCVICLSRPKDASVIHGKTGHQVACYPCAKRLRRRGKACPVCRRPIQKVIRNYLV